MSYLEEQMNLLKFDKRLLEINFKNGSLSEDEYKKHLETLEDNGDKAEGLSLGSDRKKDQEESVNDSSDLTDDENKEGTEPTTSSINSDPFGSGY